MTRIVLTSFYQDDVATDVMFFCLDIFMFVNNYSFYLSQGQFKSLALSQLYLLNVAVFVLLLRCKLRCKSNDYLKITALQHFEFHRNCHS